MALPFIILGVAAAATAFVAKKLMMANQKKSEADDVLDRAQRRFDKHKESFDLANETTSKKLAELGEKELKIGKDFNEFKTIADDLLARMAKDGHKDLRLKVPQHNINKIQSLAISATEYLTTVVGAGCPVRRWFCRVQRRDGVCRSVYRYADCRPVWCGGV